MIRLSILFILFTSFLSCNAQYSPKAKVPVIVTEKVKSDSDDPAIWFNKEDPAKSFILGTDKGNDTLDGGLYVFDLGGKIDYSKSILGLKRPNNVDVAYGLEVLGKKTDIAVCTERNTNTIRVFSLPEMKRLDNGGIPVFEGESLRSPMGVALFKDSRTSIIYAFVSRKTGPKLNYIFQYLLSADDNGVVKGQLVRKFGKFSGKKEIESIVVDNELGYVYYSDEGKGVRKYYAHPDSSINELALFARKKVKEDHEGLSIFKNPDGTGFILLSDQQANQFNVYPREGLKDNPHKHGLIKKILASSIESDGSEVLHLPLNNTFKKGIFVAMSTDGTFQYYRWEDFFN
ncbi:MAG: phytase [Bacteroidetes bacterium]|nr:phytase [Bacteroidota bacterium]